MSTQVGFSTSARIELDAVRDRVSPPANLVEVAARIFEVHGLPERTRVRVGDRALKGDLVELEPLDKLAKGVAAQAKAVAVPRGAVELLFRRHRHLGARQADGKKPVVQGNRRVHGTPFPRV